MGNLDHGATSHKDLNQRADLLYNPSLLIHTQFIGAPAVILLASYNSLGHINSTQPILEMEIPMDWAACKAVHKIPDIALVIQDNDHVDQTPY
jgi:hypothetical protein